MHWRWKNFQWRQKKEMVEQEQSSGMVEFFKKYNTIGVQFSEKVVKGKLYNG